MAHHKATARHTTIHNDPMALDIDSLLQLELKHTEEAEQHEYQTPPER